jgi:hypothetical protein
MLLKHSFAYLLARGLPGVLNFAALALYTRLLTPEEYGRYALLITGISLVDVIVFQWLRLVLLRFLQGQAQPGRFLGSILAQYFLLTAIVSILGLGAAAAWPDPVWQKMLILAVPLLVTHGAVELTLEISRARLVPGRYGFMLGTKAAVALGSGMALARVGLGATAPVLGLVIGQMVALLGFARHAWRGVSLHWPAPEQRRRQLAYGLPLILTFGLGWIVAGSDRLLLGWMMGEDAAGIYSAGYDLAFQSLTLALTIINTAAYPLAIRALQEGGAKKAREQLARFHPLQAGDDPAFGKAQRLGRGGRLRQALAHVHEHEARRVPQLVAEVAVALATAEVELEVAPGARERGEREAQGIRTERRDAVGEFLARALRDRCGLFRVHQAGGALLDERFQVDAVDEVDRVEHVALGLRHLLPLGIADEAVDIDVLERNLAGDVFGHHHHARDPEENDVKAGDKHG